MQNLRDRAAKAIAIIKDDKRIGKEISDAELSKLLDVSEGTLSAYKKGRGTLKATTIEGLEKHFYFNIEWLYHGKGEPFPDARNMGYKEICGPEEPAAAPPEAPPPVAPSREIELLLKLVDQLSARVNEQNHVITQLSERLKEQNARITNQWKQINRDQEWLWEICRILVETGQQGDIKHLEQLSDVAQK